MTSSRYCACALAAIVLTAGAVAGEETKKEEPAATKKATAQQDPPKPFPGQLKKGEAQKGLADAYALDRGIEKDPAVIFADGFENEDPYANGWRYERPAWDGRARRRFRTVADEKHGGARSLELTGETGKDSGGLMNRSFAGEDLVYARFYLKLREDFDVLHHFLSLQANAGEGVKAESFSIGLQPCARYYGGPLPGPWVFCATYHKRKGKYWDMLGAQGKNSPEDVISPTGKWHCVEFMVKANAPGQADGEIAFWIDGVPQRAFKALDLRTDAKLKVNLFSLFYYATPDLYWNKNLAALTCWIDDLVVARKYIGPMNEHSRKEAH